VPTKAFSRTIATARQGIDGEGPIGLQLYVSQQGCPLVDLAFGGAGRAGPMSRDSVVPWFSAGKPITALCLALLHDAGQLHLDDPVAAHLPEFEGPGKDAVRLTHLLSHSVAFERDLTPMEVRRSWQGTLDASLGIAIRRGIVPGETAAYSPFLGWQLLAEVVQRVSHQPFDAFVRRHVFDPLGMEGCFFGIPVGDLDSGRVRVAEMFDTTSPTHQLLPWVNDNRFWSAVVPGMGARGPVRRLGALYEALLDFGPVGRCLGLEPATRARMTTTQRSGRFDPFYGGAVGWGLGFITDRRMFAGHRSSSGVFGHDGYRCALSFADPGRGLVVCLAGNGLPTRSAHFRRLRHIIHTLLDELEGADPVTAARSRRVGPGQAPAPVD
jgi:CubicO group peptidase (beta-lactamase class C family)